MNAIQKETNVLSVGGIEQLRCRFRIRSIHYGFIEACHLGKKVPDDEWRTRPVATNDPLMKLFKR